MYFTPAQLPDVFASIGARVSDNWGNDNLRQFYFLIELGLVATITCHILRLRRERSKFIVSAHARRFECVCFE
jgi:hypothetical protein